MLLMHQMFLIYCIVLQGNSCPELNAAGSYVKIIGTDFTRSFEFCWLALRATICGESLV